MNNKETDSEPASELSPQIYQGESKSQIQKLFDAHIEALRDSVYEHNLHNAETDRISLADRLEQEIIAKGGRLTPLDAKMKPNERELILIARLRPLYSDWLSMGLIDSYISTTRDEKVNARKKLKKIAKQGGDAKAAKLKEKKANIRQVWANGNYKSRDICAEQEYSGLGFDSYKTARNALTNTPAPNPWPAKKVK